MTQSIITYLKELEANNNREWYHEHKGEFRQANQEFEDLVWCLMQELGRDEPGILMYEPKELTFKIVRDTRFSHDKSPYNPAFRCHISSGGKLPVPVGYFLYLAPGNRSFLGGGLFADMFKDATAKIREHINIHGEEFKKIITAQDFASDFRVQGTALKKVPKEYDPAHSMAEYLKYKSWYIEYHFEDKLLDDREAFVRFAVEKFSKMRPFHEFLNEALKSFQMPAR